jgi:hypothetical protein
MKYSSSRTNPLCPLLRDGCSQGDLQPGRLAAERAVTELGKHLFVKANDGFLSFMTGLVPGSYGSSMDAYQNI